MHIVRFQIENYKSFRSTPAVPLTQGFNVVVGQNNVGKTALVEALRLRFDQQLHRSLHTVAVRNAPVAGVSTVNVTFQLSRDELLQCLAQLSNFFVPLEDGRRPEEVAQALASTIQDTNTLKATFNGGAVVEARFVGLAAGPNGGNSALLHVTPAGSIELVQKGTVGVDEK